MTTRSTSSPSSANTTLSHSSLFPSDVDDRLLFLIRDIQCSIVIFGIFLGSIVVIFSLKSISELRNYGLDSGGKRRRKTNWLVSKLKSKYAPPAVICANGSLMCVMNAILLLTYYDIGHGKFCDRFQRVYPALYCLNLWTTYMLFEVRRISTGTKSFKGKKYWLMQAVRTGTMCIPFFSIWMYYAAAGIYLEDVRHCINAFDPNVSALMGVTDGMLSVGHVMLFIFAVRQRSIFKVAAENMNTSEDSIPNSETNLRHLNRNMAVARSGKSNTASNKIRKIARRNLNLALVTVASTAVTMIIVSWANLALPPQESNSTRSFLYLGHVSMLAGTIDSTVNSISILIMTTSWLPTCMKQLSRKFSATIAAAHNRKESDVSTLGRGTSVAAS